MVTLDKIEKLTKKDSNKKINAKPDNKAEDHKKEKLITSQESSLCVHVCVCRLFTKKRKKIIIINYSI